MACVGTSERPGLSCAAATFSAAWGSQPVSCPYRPLAPFPPDWGRGQREGPRPSGQPFPLHPHRRHAGPPFDPRTHRTHRTWFCRDRSRSWTCVASTATRAWRCWRRSPRTRPPTTSSSWRSCAAVWTRAWPVVALGGRDAVHDPGGGCGTRSGGRLACADPTRSPLASLPPSSPCPALPLSGLNTPPHHTHTHTHAHTFFLVCTRRAGLGCTCPRLPCATATCR